MIIISNLLCTAMLFATTYSLLTLQFGAVYYVVMALLLVWLPLGKIKHVLYFFFARYHLGFSTAGVEHGLLKKRYNMTNKIINEQKAKALAIISNTNDSKLETHLNACVRCGLCASSCMYYLTMKEGKYIPARKVDLVSSIYRRYKTRQGSMFPSIFHARELNQETCDEMVDSLFGACTMCGRCVKHCSIGVRYSFPCEKRT